MNANNNNNDEMSVNNDNDDDNMINTINKANNKTSLGLRGTEALRGVLPGAFV